MVSNRILPWVTDDDTYNIWDNWCIKNRDLIFLNKEGNYISRINISDYNENYIIDLINELLSEN